MYLGSQCLFCLITVMEAAVDCDKVSNALWIQYTIGHYAGKITYVKNVKGSMNFHIKTQK